MNAPTSVQEAAPHPRPAGVAATADAPRWHVIHAKPRQEKALSRDLAAMGINHYLPVREESRHHGLQKRLLQVPLFPGYLFLLGTLCEAYEADRTRRVVQVIAVSDQPRLDWEISQIRLALTRKAPLDPYPWLVEGRRVEVRGGPLRGLQGIVRESSGASRLILGVKLLGQAVSVEIEKSLLEPLD